MKYRDRLLLEQEFLDFIKFLKDKELFMKYCKEANKPFIRFYRLEQKIQKDRTLNGKYAMLERERIEERKKRKNEERIRKITETQQRNAKYKAKKPFKF